VVQELRSLAVCVALATSSSQHSLARLVQAATHAAEHSETLQRDVVAWLQKLR
jgi:hypothetical protein